MYRRRVALVALLCFEVPRHKGGGTIGHHKKKHERAEWATQVLGTIKKKKKNMEVSRPTPLLHKALGFYYFGPFFCNF